MNKTHYCVIIVGAGMAGLSAAEHLSCSGMKDILVLEATNRYGGRIHTTGFGKEGKQIELGANWIHGGTPDNCIFNLAKKNGLLSDKLIRVERHLGTFVTSSGEIIDKDISLRLYDVFTEILEGTKNLSSLNLQNLEEYLSEKLEEVMTKVTQEEKMLTHRFANYFRNYVAFHGGDDSYNMSARGYGSFEDLPGGDVKIPTGFSTVFKSIIENLPSEAITFGHSVTKIVYGNDEVQVSCSNGQQYSANHVILTVSLGVLKASHLQLFVPQLPEDKAKAIKRVGFGKVSKIFIYYALPFWKPGDLKHVNFIWSNEEYERKDLNDEWTIAINGIEEVLNNPNVLLSWIGGKLAEVVENLPERKLAEGCASILRSFLNDTSIPVPDRACCSRWCTDPSFLGTYSYQSCSSEISDHDVLASPLPSPNNPRLLFCGEATQTKFFSTVHGARMSGIREAKRILDWRNITTEKHLL